MLLTTLGMAVLATASTTTRHTIDIINYLSERELVLASPDGCLTSPIMLPVASNRAELSTCKAAAKEANLNYTMYENGTVGGAGVCWGGDGVDDNTSNGGVCGRVFLIDKYPVKYDKTALPLAHGEGVTTVWLSATIIKLNSLDIKAQTYSYSMYFREEWFDRRLSWNPRDFDGQDSIDWSSTSTSSTDPFLWTPDGFFSTATTVSNPDSDESFSIRSDGYVLWSRLLQITSFCEMNLRYYPFDYQECISDVESYSHSHEDLKFDVSQNITPIDLDPNIDTACSVCSVNTVNAYKLGDLTSHKIFKEYRGVTFSGVKWVFPFTRATATYFITMFLPLWLICILSAGSCWIDNGAAVARVGMGITTVLVLISQMNGLKTNIATVRYITSIDVYLLLCLSFTVINVIEYGAVNYLTNMLKSKEEAMSFKHENMVKRIPSKVLLKSASSMKRIVSPVTDEGMEKAQWTEPVEPTPAEDGYFRENFEKFVEEGDEIRIERVRALLHSLHVPDERILNIVKEVRRPGGKTATYDDLLQALCRDGIFDDYGVKATRFGITKTSLDNFEARYRVVSLLWFIAFNVVWFLVVLVLADNGASDHGDETFSNGSDA